MTTYFISGHLDLSDSEFQEHYVPHLLAAMAEPDVRFIVGDAPGADHRAQLWLRERKALVTIYHMLARPRHNEGFGAIGGYATDAQRDTAMTQASNKDIAWVRPGRERSGTAKNLARREQKSV